MASTSGTSNEREDESENLGISYNEPKALIDEEVSIIYGIQQAIDAMIQRVGAEKISSRNFVKALEYIKASYSLLCVAERDMVNLDNFYDSSCEVKYALANLERATVARRQNLFILQSDRYFFFKDASIDEKEGNAKICQHSITEQNTPILVEDVMKADWEKYCPSTRLPLDRGVLLPFSMYRAIENHCSHVLPNFDEDTTDSSDSDLIKRLRDFLKDLGSLILSEFVDFVSLVGRNVETSKCDSRFLLAFDNKIKELNACILESFDLKKKLTELEDFTQARSFENKSLNNEFQSLLKINLSENRIINLISLAYQIHSCNYRVEGLVFSCIDTLKAIVNFRHQIDVRNNAYTIKKFVINYSQILNRVKFFRINYNRFLASYENTSEIREKDFLKFKLNFAKKFEKLLQIMLKVNIDFWNSYKTKSP